VYYPKSTKLVLKDDKYDDWWLMQDAWEDKSGTGQKRTAQIPVRQFHI
jgi:hypothetical protein